MPPPHHNLTHIHLGRCSFLSALSIQTSLTTAHKADASPATTTTNTRPRPPPTILTSEFDPVYTLGRREHALTPAQADHLLASNRASVHHTSRGGLTTFHGPGQLTAYVVTDLKWHGLTPRCYVRRLEGALIATCARYGIRAFTTPDTGAWTSEERKIGAVGVHLRRNVTAFGVGLNVSTDLWWFERIVACGLEGKETTSFEREGVVGKSVEEVGDVFVQEMAGRLGCSGVDKKIHVWEAS